MNLKVSERGIIYDDDTQEAVGILGMKSPPADIVWAPAYHMSKVFDMVWANRVRISIRAPRRRKTQ